MNTITREFTKEQLVEHLRTRIEHRKGLIASMHIDRGYRDYLKLELRSSEIALASLEAEIHSYTFEDDSRPLYTAPPALVANIHPLLEFAREYIESWDLGMTGDSSLLASAKKAIADSSAHQPAPAPVNAEPVAWLWSHRKHPSEVTLVRPEDDDKAEAALWSGWSCQALYAAPPAPVSVPEPIKRNDADGWWMYKGRRVGGGCAEWYNRAIDDCRAAMLQGAGGNSPAIPDGWVAVPVEPTIGILDEFDSIIDYGAEDSKDAWSRLLAAAWIKSLPAAPQQEVAQALAKGMERYGDAMLKLAKKEDSDG